MGRLGRLNALDGRLSEFYLSLTSSLGILRNTLGNCQEWIKYNFKTNWLQIYGNIYFLRNCRNILIRALCSASNYAYQFRARKRRIWKISKLSTCWLYSGCLIQVPNWRRHQKVFINPLDLRITRPKLKFNLLSKVTPKSLTQTSVI